ncbi:LOW QUALITY PROTEIN: ankyrin repeat domain-containing protein 39-like [Pomacea canaliculata]|uniref:LOW QUALITY PROTEIN: ankyrin repeat domain-containing protein 39-like n=1 Tax=Pomacea canaliculata TaxID=400727 RepID=UPI000D73806C|nr:LOW QUALITY PROTEIN: ankyrin repeat domain-containing protein 39-like [Pomacea canaliculata]
MASHHHDQGCCESATVSSVNQTMDEMNFERGLWSAALSGEIDELERRLAHGADVNARDKSGYTALHYAARSGHRDVCCLLLNHGAEVNATTTAGSATPLHRAAYMGHADIVQLLLSHGANPHLTDSDGMTALHKATDRVTFRLLIFL